MSAEGQQEEEEDNLYGLFVCEEYVEQIFSFGAEQQALLCSKMCTTDHDLTGQIVWPASRILAWYLVLHPELLCGKSVVELGAGCGLAGFVASHQARQVDITDGNDIVLRLLQKNKEHLQSENVHVRKLLWGVRAEVESLYPIAESFPEVIIGADVILWPNQIINLLSTIRWLLLPGGLSSQCYISYVHRANTTYDLLLRLAAELGLSLNELSAKQFLPDTCTDIPSIDGRILHITLLPSTVERRDEILRESDSELRKMIDNNYLPC